MIVNINEHQDASDGKYGSSDVALQFSTNEIKEANSVIFNTQERVVCNDINLNLGSYGNNVTTYSVHMIIPNNNPPEYKCIYYYPGGIKPATIFTVPVLSQLMPELQRPVPSSSDIRVSYNPDKNVSNNPDKNPPHYCQVQVTANAMGQTPASGDSVQEEVLIKQTPAIYPGPNDGSLNVGSLSGQGYLIITQTCTWEYNHGNTGDNGSQFASLSGTYMTSAGLYVTWVQPNSPTQGST